MVPKLGNTLLAVLALALPMVRPVPEVRYRIEALPVPQGCASFSDYFHGISRTGVAVGAVDCQDSIGLRTVAWTGEGYRELPTLGGPHAYAMGLSPDGTKIVGAAEAAQQAPDGNYVSLPVVWEQGSQSVLETLGGPIGAAVSVNLRGEIAGGCLPIEVDPRLNREPVRACLWNSAGVRDLGDLGGPEAAAYDLNASGWVVGWSNTAERVPPRDDFRVVAFLHDGSTMQSLGTLGGDWSVALGINGSGDVVGYSQTNVIDARGRREQHGFRWRRGRLEDLGSLEGGYSIAWAENDLGDVVGESVILDPQGRMRRVAVLWNGGTLRNVNDLVDDRQDWILTKATAINDAGQILVEGWHDGRPRVALLAPVRARRALSSD